MTSFGLRAGDSGPYGLVYDLVVYGLFATLVGGFVRAAGSIFALFDPFAGIIRTEGTAFGKTGPLRVSHQPHPSSLQAYQQVNIRFIPIFWRENPTMNCFMGHGRGRGESKRVRAGGWPGFTSRGGPGCAQRGRPGAAAPPSTRPESACNAPVACAMAQVTVPARAKSRDSDGAIACKMPLRGGLHEGIPCGGAECLQSRGRLGV